MHHLMTHDILDFDKLAIDELGQDLLRIWNWAKRQVGELKIKIVLPTVCQTWYASED